MLREPERWQIACDQMYEVLKLIAKMHKTFKNDVEFQNGLRVLARGQEATSLKQEKLNPLRNWRGLSLLAGPDRRNVRESDVQRVPVHRGRRECE